MNNKQNYQYLENGTTRKELSVTRRGKIALTVGGLALMAGGLMGLKHAASEDVSPVKLDGKHKVVNVVDLDSGTGTVWDIAKKAEPNQNTGAVANEISEALVTEGKDPNILIPGEGVPVPLDSQIGHVVDGSSADSVG